MLVFGGPWPGLDSNASLRLGDDPPLIVRSNQREDKSVQLGAGYKPTRKSQRWAPQPRRPRFRKGGQETNRVDDAWDEAEDGEADIDPEVGEHASLDEHGERGQEAEESGSGQTRDGGNGHSVCQIREPHGTCEPSQTSA